MEAIRVHIIGISGKAFSGKDTAAEIIAECGHVILGFADPLKRSLVQFGVPKEILWGPSSLRNTVYRGISVRQALQTLGDWAKLQRRDVLVSVALAAIYDIVTGAADYEGCLGLIPRHPRLLLPTLDEAKSAFNGYGSRGVVIPDVRSADEVEALSALGATLIRIKRPGAGLEGPAGEHVTETAMDAIPDDRFDHVILNSDSLASFRADVRACMRQQ
jgi:hypothetical protein